MSEQIKMPIVKTPSEAKQWFLDRGISITTWAQQHGFHRSVVYAALAGRTKGRRGDAHEVAIALQLKPIPMDDTESMPQSGQASDIQVGNTKINNTL
jgi:gp16 family phage-associated protein